MNHKNIRGKIIYKPNKSGKWIEFGREWWSITRHEDGQNTLRAYCEIEAGVVANRSVIRDVVYTYDKNFHPIDCFNRLHSNGKFLGSGWICFSDESAECESVGTNFGRISQKQRISEKALSLGAHPVSCDILHLARFDHSVNENIQAQNNVWMTSREHDGCSGPLLEAINFNIEYVGQKNIKVPAGNFKTHHYKFLLENHPTEELWCTDDFIFVKITVGGYMAAEFDLVELEIDN